MFGRFFSVHESLRQGPRPKYPGAKCASRLTLKSLYSLKRASFQTRFSRCPKITYFRTFTSIIVCSMRTVASTQDKYENTYPAMNVCSWLVEHLNRRFTAPSAKLSDPFVVRLNSGTTHYPPPISSSSSSCHNR